MRTLHSNRTLSVALFVVFSVGLFEGCKKEAPEEDLGALLESDPAKAIPKLMEKYQSAPGDYSTVRSLAEAHTRTTPPNWERAAAWYRKSLELPEGAAKDEKKVLQGALLGALEHLLEAGKSSQMRQKDITSMLWEANQLERELGRKDIKAGKELLGMAKVRFDGQVKNEDYADALALMGGLARIYVDEETLRTITDQRPRIETLKFDKEAAAAFSSTVRAEAIELRLYDPEQKAFTLNISAQVEVGVEGGPDPTQADFARKIEEAICGKEAAVTRLKAILNPFAVASPLGRELSETELGALFERSRKTRKTRWEGEAWDQTKLYEPGTRLVFVCTDSLALDTVIETLRAAHAAKE